MRAEKGILVPVTFYSGSRSTSMTPFPGPIEFPIQRKWKRFIFNTRAYNKRFSYCRQHYCHFLLFLPARNQVFKENVYGCFMRAHGTQTKDRSVCNKQKEYNSAPLLNFFTVNDWIISCMFPTRVANFFVSSYANSLMYLSMEKCVITWWASPSNFFATEGIAVGPIKVWQTRFWTTL